MSGQSIPASMTGFVVEAPAPLSVKTMRQVQNAVTPEEHEAALSRQAHRTALALMAASSVVTVLAGYGAWELLRAVI